MTASFARIAQDGWRVAATCWIGWLTDPRSRDPTTGHWKSWIGPGGYPYPEATAWTLLAMAEARNHGIGRDQRVSDAAEAACVLIAACAAQGGLGRAGLLYTFDTAVGLAAVHAWRPGHPAVEVLWRCVREMAAERRAMQHGPRVAEVTPDTHWSEAWGAHMLWVAAVAHAIGETNWARSLAIETLAHVSRLGAPTYSHALAYACEGLVALRGEPVFDTQLGAWWDQLRRAATPAGMCAFTDGTGPVRADVTAQTARLQRLLDPAADPGTACGLLLGWTDGNGAVAYEPGSPHANSWCTAMAVRAAVAELEAR